MTWFDFNDAPKMSGELIPAGTVAPVIMTLKTGGAAADPFLRQAQNSDALMLDVEFTITEGPFAKRKIWQMITVDGGTRDDAGNSKGGLIGRSFLRAALESAKGVKPDDNSAEAQQARKVTGYQDFDGLCFLAKIGVKKDKGGVYDDKNIVTPVTPGMKEWGNVGTASNIASAPPAAGPAPWGTTPPPQNNQPAQQNGGTPPWAQ